jgi:hypothetical protein
MLLLYVWVEVTKREIRLFLLEVIATSGEGGDIVLGSPIILRHVYA